MNFTRVASIVLLCLVFVSAVYGFSVALSISLNIQVSDAHGTYDQVLAYGPRFPRPMGDPIDNPKPN